MPEIKQQAPFLVLPDIALPNVSEDFHLDFQFYERKMLEMTGIDINEEIFRLDAQQLLMLQKIVPNFVLYDGDRTDETIDRIVSRFPDINSPASMQLTSIHELEQVVLMLYQVSFAHYINFKREDVFLNAVYKKTNRGPFPKDWCGPSSRNLFASLLEHGFSNVGYAINNQYYGSAHHYVILPFVLDGKNGTIVVDPTSEQLWENCYNPPKYKPRNAVFVVYGEKFSYKVPYFYGTYINLFPNRVIHLGDLKEKCNAPLVEARKESDRNLDFALSGEEFLRRAFENTVDVKPYLMFEEK